MHDKCGFSLLILVLALACGTPHTSAKGDGYVEMEGFEEFFESFKSKSDFQARRISFPLEVETYDILDNKQTRRLNYGDWSYIDFTKDADAINFELSAFETVIEHKSSSQVIYLRRGIDNGIRMVYHFENIDSKWFLTKIVDQST